MATADTGARRARVMFHALSHRNYRLVWTGAILSNSGTFMQGVAQSWLVLQLTDSAFWLGVDNFVMTVPGLLLTLPGGVLADVVDRQRLLIWTQVGAGLSALALAALVAAGVVDQSADVWIVLALTFVTGCCFALMGPSYQAITVDLVEREDLANAIALNSTQFQLSRVAGPLLAALAMRLFGMAGCFLANALSYAVIIWAIALVRLPPRRVAGAGKEERAPESGGQTGANVSGGTPAARAERGARAMWRDLVGGFRYVRGRPRVRLLLLCSAVVNLFGSPYLMLMAVFARDVYGWGATGLSLMMGTAGAGALCGALVLAYLGDFRRKGKFVLSSALAGGVFVACFAVAPSELALPVLFCIGFSMVSFFSVSNTLLQQLVTDEMRGRVMSMWLVSFVGAMAFGNILGGSAAERFGPRTTLAACGLVIALFAAWVAARHPRMREE